MASHLEHQQVPLKTVISHILPAMLMGLVMTVAYLGGFHKPSPHGVPVAVVGSSTSAGPLAASIQQKAGDALEVKTVPSESEARAELQKEHLSGAFVPSAKTPKLLSAPAASSASDQLVTEAFTAVAAKQDKPLAIEKVVPLDSEDPLGQNGFFYLVTLSVASYATAIAIGAAGSSRRFKDRLGLMFGAGLLIATAELAIASVFYDMFSGHGFTVWLLSIWYSLTVLGIGVGLHTVVGRFSTLVFSAIFVALNFTSSGGVLPADLQPGFFGWLNSFWIGSGFLETMRHILYFPDASMSHGIIILIGWTVFAIASLVLSYFVHLQRDRAARRHAHHKALYDTLRRTGQQGLTHDERVALELEEDVAV